MLIREFSVGLKTYEGLETLYLQTWFLAIVSERLKHIQVDAS